MYASLGCPPFLGFVLNLDGSMGFSLFTHYCSVFCAACESSTGRPLYSSPAYPLASLPSGVPLSFDVQLRRTLSNCIGVFFLRCLWLPLQGVRLSLVFALNHDGSFGFCLAFTPLGSLCVPEWEYCWEYPTRVPSLPAGFLLAGFRFVLWTLQSNTEPLQRQFFVWCVLEPKQLSPTDEISVLGFELAPFFLGKRVLLTDFTVRKQGEC